MAAATTGTSAAAALGWLRAATSTGFAQQPYQQMYQQLPPQQLPPQQQQAGWNPYAQYQQNYAYPGQQPQYPGYEQHPEAYQQQPGYWAPQQAPGPYQQAPQQPAPWQQQQQQQAQVPAYQPPPTQQHQAQHPYPGQMSMPQESPVPQQESSQPQQPHQQHHQVPPPRDPSPPMAHHRAVILDTADLFCPPGRARRPKRIAVIMRGLPGSGKSWLARKLRELELKHRAEAPRIHAIDDYFVTEVEKEEVEELPGKKPRTKTVRHSEYCYEAELEEPYMASLVKAFRRTVEEGRFPVVIVDAPHLLADDLKAYWASGQAAGYEVYIQQPLETDADQCYQRQIHGHSLAFMHQAEAAWEPTPAVYPQLSARSLLEGEGAGRKRRSIQEVDMEQDSGAVKAGMQRKKAKRQAANGFDGLKSGADRLLVQAGSNGRVRNGVLKKGPSDRHFKVRWADQDEPDADAGFTMGRSTRQTKREHKAERNSFKSILLGGRA
eukprot:jgi/Astpho2/5648/fgenesh1_pg.00079_%23_81_t